MSVSAYPIPSTELAKGNNESTLLKLVFTTFISMRLADDFFRVVSKECTDELIRFKVRMNSEHPIYKAHFPDNPITPGVCLLQIATELLEGKMGQRLSLLKLTRMKFRHVVRPGDELWFVYSNMEMEENVLRVRVNIDGDDINYAQMFIELRMS